MISSIYSSAWARVSLNPIIQVLMEIGLVAFALCLVIFLVIFSLVIRLLAVALIFLCAMPVVVLSSIGLIREKVDELDGRKFYKLGFITAHMKS